MKVAFIKGLPVITTTGRYLKAEIALALEKIKQVLDSEDKFTNIADLILQYHIRTLKMMDIYYHHLPANFNYEYTYAVDEKRKAIVLFYPISLEGRDIEYHAVGIAIHDRRHYTPPSKAAEHLRSLYNFVMQVAKERWLKVKNVTLLLYCPMYTKSVKGFIKELTKSRKIAVFFRRDPNILDALIWLFNHVKRLLNKRLENLREALERKRATAFGVVKEMIERFEAIINGLKQLIVKMHDMKQLAYKIVSSV